MTMTATTVAMLAKSSSTIEITSTPLVASCCRCSTYARALTTCASGEISATCSARSAGGSAKATDST